MLAAGCGLDEAHALWTAYLKAATISLHLEAGPHKDQDTKGWDFIEPAYLSSAARTWTETASTDESLAHNQNGD